MGLIPSGSLPKNSKRLNINYLLIFFFSKCTTFAPLNDLCKLYKRPKRQEMAR